MPVSIRLRVERRATLGRLEFMTRTDWAAVGREARETIVRRTLSGRDQDGRPFRPYSPEYAAQKRRLGAGDRPNLQLSGAMLNAIRVLPDARGVTLEFDR